MKFWYENTRDYYYRNDIFFEVSKQNANAILYYHQEKNLITLTCNLFGLLSYCHRIKPNKNQVIGQTITNYIEFRIVGLNVALSTEKLVVPFK